MNINILVMIMKKKYVTIPKGRNIYGCPFSESPLRSANRNWMMKRVIKITIGRQREYMTNDAMIVDDIPFKLDEGFRRPPPL
jgi:hypothetical protein